MSFYDLLISKFFGGGAGSGGGADWNASEGEAGYVKNRTHWENKSETAIFEANEFTVGSDGAYFLQNAFTLSAGTKYAVVWDGVEYTCEAEAGTYSGAPMIYMGNPVIIGGEMNEIPFAIGTIPANGANAIASLIPNSTHSVAIYPYDVHKIPSKYVPSTALFIEVEVTGKDTEIDYNVNYGGSISDLDQAYAEGRPIWAVVRDADDISGMDGYMLPLVKRAEYPEAMIKGYFFESICNTSQLQLFFAETKGVKDIVLTVRTFNDLIDKRLRELGLID